MSTWLTVTGPLAVCVDENCSWGANGDRIGAQSLALLARAHANKTGHRVSIERGQMRYVEPKATPALPPDQGTG